MKDQDLAGSRPMMGVGSLPAFPKQQMLVLALCRISEPIAFMSIFPYSSDMITYFNVTTDDNEILFYAGLVTSAFTFAEFATGLFWGRMSDKIGRKPVLLFGLVGTALSSLVFGFAPNFAVALFARALGGALNGNIGVLQTTVAELIEVKEHEKRAFAVMPTVWCIGSIIGPAIGGLLAQPCTNYQFCSQTSLLGRYPFLLPNLFSAACVCLGVLIGVLFLEETHPIKKYEGDHGLELGRQILSFLPSVRRQRCYDDSAEKHPLLSAGDALPAYTEHCRKHSSSDVSDCCEAVFLDGVPSRTSLKSEASSGASTPTFNRNVILNIISYGILAFHTMSFDQQFPVFMRSDAKWQAGRLPFEFAGGFNIESVLVGQILSVQGLFSIVATWFIFPWISSRVGTLPLFQTLAISYFLLYLVTPYLLFLQPTLQIAGIFVLLFWKCIYASMAYPSNAILIKNSAPSTLQLGTINGSAASTASLCRALGPMISGMIGTVGLRAGYTGLMWWACAFVTLIGGMISLRLTNPEPRSDKMEASDTASLSSVDADLEARTCLPPENTRPIRPNPSRW